MITISKSHQRLGSLQVVVRSASWYNACNGGRECEFAAMPVNIVH